MLSVPDCTCIVGEELDDVMAGDYGNCTWVFDGIDFRRGCYINEPTTCTDLDKGFVDVLGKWSNAEACDNGKGDYIFVFWLNANLDYKSF